MKTKILLLFIVPTFCFSQEFIKGKIKIDTPEVLGILVINLNNESESKTDGFGRFSINAEIGDLLIIAAPHIHKKRHIVQENDFKKEIEIQIEALPVEIESIEITRSNITSESLGLVPEGQKRYTPAERRLKTATDMELMVGFGFAFSLDPILNALSGRTKMLKKELEIERFNKNMTLTESYLSDELLISQFNIPINYINSFRMFLVDNPDFMEVMKTNNKDNIISKAFSLSEEFQKIISDEQ